MYLLVLDDVWNDDQEKWFELKKVVACGSTGSSIIVTTRLKKNADIMRTLPSHLLTGLSKQYCWMLLRERAFGQENEQFPKLEAIGKQIANKCAGVPLAAKALGGLLRFKREEKDWNHVKESEIWELPQEENLILPALRLSYHHLSLAGALEAVDVGNDICDELVMRSILQYDSDANTTTLIMHDLLHDLAQSIMENKIPGAQVQRTNVRSASRSKIRQFENIRCKLPDSLEALPKKMRYLINLRHLFLEYCDSLRGMPSKIGELSSLRTLSKFIVGRDGGRRLEELQRLKLGGNLKIHHLDRVKDPMDAEKANLADKENLRCLGLDWGSNGKHALKSGEEDLDIDEKMLEALEPHPNLEIFEIRAFMGRCLPVWMSNSTLDKVVEIHLINCNNCLRLPQLGKLPRLKKMSLATLTALEYVIEEEVVRSGNALVSARQFPSLEKLSLRYLPNIKMLIQEQVMMRLSEAFSNLEELYVERCPSLILPPLSTSFTKLNKLTCTKLLLSSLSNADLHNLTNLQVIFEEENSGDACTVGVETLQSLTNLKILSIGTTDTTELSLPEQGLQHLTALEELYILKCPALVELPDGIKHLHRLHTVLLRDLPKMVSVPKPLQHLSSSLKSLQMYELPQLSSLPDWFGDLTSLKELFIHDCPKIASLPDSIRRMTNLQYLQVCGCPELEKRCERAKGEDRHKIQHIRYLYISSSS
ncbi:PREDICTED: putative disease resistance protein RGA4 [Erythranthe guttata]|uniref:putative disease resistance protein RGA4 n=1 Tax=Erythranthe guttata TaxID=4155 RepID=UPI00064D7FB8|nr:PREDICTED: putative disease resistance protein RGA4 [Erythranthe guttata]|eukprot:XP_012854111.1 PREDICTED: putative disease resistance protein RGA4 [Erythranthe guttata]